jgi:hypothetical protein
VGKSTRDLAIGRQVSGAARIGSRLPRFEETERREALADDRGSGAAEPRVEQRRVDAAEVGVVLQIADHAAVFLRLDRVGLPLASGVLARQIEQGVVEPGQAVWVFGGDDQDDVRLPALFPLDG